MSYENDPSGTTTPSGGGGGDNSNNVTSTDPVGQQQPQLVIGVMSSISTDCNDLKRAYDTCFNSWFSERFLKGDASRLDTCDALLASYTACVKKALQTRNVDLEEIAKEHLGTDKERIPG